MRILKPVAAIAALGAACVMPAGELRAQSFLQQIFKNFAADPPPQPSQYRAPSPAGKTHIIKTQPVFGFGEKVARMSSRTPADLYSSRRPTGSYKTVCVRMCDGFYWPVSSSTRRSGFHRDALTCTSSCDSEARLFYLPRNARSVKGMRDLTGRVYDHTPNAYVYRKKLIDGCTCKPAPWARRERARHARYAWAEEMKELDAKARADIAAAEVIAGAGAKSAEVVAGAPTGASRVAAIDPQGLDILNENPETLTVLTATDPLLAAIPDTAPNADPANPEALAIDLPPTALAAMTPIRESRYSTLAPGKSASRPRKTAWPKKPLADSKKNKKRKKKSGKKKYAASKPKPSSGFAGLFGGGNKKYKWPGDK